MKVLENACQKLLNGMIDSEFYNWPPSCIGMFFQPERPQLDVADDNVCDDISNVN